MSGTAKNLISSEAGKEINYTLLDGTEVVS